MPDFTPKYFKFNFAWDSAPDPLISSQCSPNHVSGFEEREKARRKRKEEEKNVKPRFHFGGRVPLIRNFSPLKLYTLVHFHTLLNRFSVCNPQFVHRSKY